MILLDASALLALLNDEPGAAIVETFLLDAAVLSVNLEEVVGKLAQEGMRHDAIDRALAPLALPVHSFTEEMAWVAGEARPRLPQGVGIADRCCLAAASVLGAGVVTADRMWREAAAVFGVEATLVR